MLILCSKAILLKINIMDFKANKQFYLCFRNFFFSKDENFVEIYLKFQPKIQRKHLFYLARRDIIIRDKLMSQKNDKIKSVFICFTPQMMDPLIKTKHYHTTSLTKEKECLLSSIWSLWLLPSTLSK